MEHARAGTVKADTTTTSSLKAAPQKAASATCACLNLNGDLQTYFDFLIPHVNKCEKWMI